jgi:hypothetical protein
MRHHPINEQSQVDLNSSVTAVTQTMADMEVDQTRERRVTKEEERERRREKSQRKTEAISGIISLEEDMRRLFEECEISRDNCRILADSLVYATPEGIVEDPLIQVRSSPYPPVIDTDSITCAHRSSDKSASSPKKSSPRKSTGRPPSQIVRAQNNSR